MCYACNILNDRIDKAKKKFSANLAEIETSIFQFVNAKNLTIEELSDRREGVMIELPPSDCKFCEELKLQLGSLHYDDHVVVHEPGNGQFHYHILRQE